MREISRRALFTGGVGLTVVAGAAASGLGLIQGGILPGKYRLAQVLGECGATPLPPPGPLPARETVTFWSAYRRRAVRMVILTPAAAPPRSALSVVIALHGLGGSALGAADLYAPTMTQADVTRFAVIAVDGGSTYWHERSDRDDLLGMIIHEILPRAAARGFAVARIGIIGYSMGGYGALLLAERLSAGATLSAKTKENAGQPGPGTIAATVAAASPAIFASYPDARAADPGAFASPEEFARNNVLAALGALRQVPAWISCGSSDPFAAVTQLVRDRLGQLTGRPAAGGIASGCHDDAFWARTAPSALEFLGQYLAP
jgi:S-formylglutathione hydrolase FrmB